MKYYKVSNTHVVEVDPMENRAVDNGIAFWLEV